MEKQPSCHESVILTLKYLTVPFPTEHHRVEYRHFRIADINLKIDWGTNTIHAERGQLIRVVNIAIIAIGCMRLLNSRKEVCAY